MKKGHKIWSCSTGTKNTSAHDLMIMNKISQAAVKFLGTEIKRWQLPPTITCLVLCRDERFWDCFGQGPKTWSRCSTGKPKLAYANPYSASYSVLHMTGVTETRVTTLISKGYWRECLWAQDLSAQTSTSFHTVISFFVSFVGEKEQFAK